MSGMIDIRSDFPALNDSVYLNVAARGLLSRTTRQALDDLADGHMLGTAVKEDWISVGVRARASFARIFHARREEIAFTKNVSDGLNTIAAAIPWRPGDSMVFCPDFEHPNNVYTWLNLKRRGVDVRMVPLRDNALDVDAMIAQLDARTRLLTVSSVSFCTGFRADLKRLGDACRAAGAFFLVDAAQSSGIIDTDVHDCCIDGLATSTSKGLLGLYGQGFLYCREDWIERLTPAYLSRFGIDAGGVHESEMGPLEYALYTSARRFEVGNMNWPGIIAVEASMLQLLKVGGAVIEEHAVALSRRLSDGLTALGYPVQRPPDEASRSHIVTVGERTRHGARQTGSARLNRLSGALERAGVVHSVRRSVLRFATHMYNNDRDVDRVLEVAGDLSAGGRRAAGHRLSLTSKVHPH